MVDRRADRIGQALGPYRLTRLLGAGGFGEVYEADHQLLQQTRAIKLLLEQHFHDLSQRERFLREARSLATLEHSNILPVLEVGEEGNVLYLVMPFYRRGTLNDLLKQGTRPLPLAEVERFLVQMCAAVGYAHARHIAHLDLKPENMLLHEDGRLVLSDFGLAHLIKQGRLEAGSSASWGTPYYMAPEQIRGQPELRSDLYALGIILYQLLTNQRPFTGNAPEAVMMKHLLEAPPPLHAVSPAAPASLEPVIRKALEKRPEDRYATADALLTDFRAAMSILSPRPAQPPAPGASPMVPTLPMNTPATVLQPTAPVSSEGTSHAATPANIMQTMGTGCQIELQDGRYCSVTAVGRCTTCGRAFCPTHQAREWYNYGPVPYVDMCAPCLAKTPAKVAAAEAAKRQAEVYDAENYIMLGSARTDLLASGVQPVAIYWVKRHWEWKRKGIFRRYSSEQVEVVTPIGHGWILGPFEWEYSLPPEGKNSSGKKVYEDWLTALLAEPDALPDPLKSYFDRYLYSLIRVQPYSGSYEALVSNDHFRGDWIATAEAVKRLIRASS